MIAVVVFLVTVCFKKSHAEVVGSITVLPPITLNDLCMWPALDSVTNCLINNDHELHTWRQWGTGTNLFKMKLEWSVLGGDNFIVTLFYNTLLLDKAQVSRIDGELTQSVTVESKGWNKQVVTWLMADKSCKQRTYHTDKSTGEWILQSKAETNCKYPISVFSYTNISRTLINRKNFWYWGDRPLTSWNINNSITSGFWGGAVMTLPTESGISSVYCQSKNLLHTWQHLMARNYKLLLYRYLDGGKVRFFIEIRYIDMILDSGIEVKRFDDDMLTSVTVMSDQTLSDNRPITQTDNFEVAYKLTSGECYVRDYQMETDTKGEALNKVKFGWQTRCQLLYQQKVYYKSRFTTSDNQNGWNY